MSPRKSSLMMIGFVMLLAACGTQNSAPPAISVAFTEGFLPPTSMMVGDSCGIAATVTNDSKNLGVNWTATCGSTQCGSFAGSGASAQPVTYTAPATIPSGGTVTVTATSAADPTKFVSSSPIPISENPSTNCVHPGGLD